MVNPRQSLKIGWKLWKFWFPVIAYSGIIFWVSSLPRIQPPLSGYSFDKFFHALEYAPFGFLSARSLFHTNSGRSAGWIIGVAAVLALVYGISDEYHQSFVEGRYSDGWDVLADVAGAVLGAGSYLKWRVNGSINETANNRD